MRLVHLMYCQYRRRYIYLVYKNILLKIVAHVSETFDSSFQSPAPFQSPPLSYTRREKPDIADLFLSSNGIKHLHKTWHACCLSV